MLTERDVERVADAVANRLRPVLLELVKLSRPAPALDWWVRPAFKLSAAVRTADLDVLEPGLAVGLKLLRDHIGAEASELAQMMDLLRHNVPERDSIEWRDLHRMAPELARELDALVDAWGPF